MAWAASSATGTSARRAHALRARSGVLRSHGDMRTRVPRPSWARSSSARILRDGPRRGPLYLSADCRPPGPYRAWSVLSPVARYLSGGARTRPRPSLSAPLRSGRLGWWYPTMNADAMIACLARPALARLPRGMAGQARSRLAQTTVNGSIRGMITDEQGACCPASRSAPRAPPSPAPSRRSATRAGAYRLIDLPPGEYMVTAELMGFAKTRAPRRAGARRPEPRPRHRDEDRRRSPRRSR